MKLNLHPKFNLTESSFGKEKSPILIIDNFVEQADNLVDFAIKQKFVQNSNFYPGLRAETPLTYQQLLLSTLEDKLIDYFQLDAKKLTFNICQYSIVTQPADKLTILQRIPHFDSLDKNGLATVHYLFKKDLGGTSFYRHKKTSFEYINDVRKIDYFRSLESENDGPNMPKLSDGYIYGDTALYEHIHEQKGIFNRMIIYRRNSLHSGSIDKHFIPDPNPLSGRLSINSFLDPLI